MNYVVVLGTYFLLMGLGRILLFVSKIDFLPFMIVLIYAFIWDKRNFFQAKLSIHAVIMTILQIIILQYLQAPNLTICYSCFVCIICILMYILRVEYKELCKNPRKCSK